ncbi:MAG: hypothetical protein GY913_13790 [Proteobacteria bacterium]|nr:hypothetical protein [Pseudomonadota bacterium]MCP4917980.1 hypothetical protein [Pseudomonadota bacterium]
MSLLVLTHAFLSLVGCGTMNTARPLSPGEHAAGLTVGGALLDMGAPIPVPSAVVEGRSGVTTLADRPLDVNYGVNLTAIAFGQAGLHVGAGWLLLDPESGPWPALSVADRLYVYSNHMDTTKDDRSWLLIDQLELTASWKLGESLLYVGAAEYLDVRNPGLLLSPFAGAELRRRRLGVQLEVRWLAVNQPRISDAIPWMPDGRGAIQPTLGFSYRFGGDE